MKTNLTRKDVTPELIDAGAAYLVALAKTQLTAEAVKPVQAEVFADFEFYNDLMVKHGAERERITDPDDLYLSEDEEQVATYYAAVDQRLRADGIKPDDMPADHCPLLVAKHKLTQTENALIVAAARMMDVDEPENFNHLLLCQANGLETRQEFIELTAKLVVNL